MNSTIISSAPFSDILACVPSHWIEPELDFYLWKGCSLLFFLAIFVGIANIKVAIRGMIEHDAHSLKTNAVMKSEYGRRFSLAYTNSHSTIASAVQVILSIASMLRVWIFLTDPWGTYKTYLHGTVRAVFFRLPTSLILIVSFQLPLKYMAVIGLEECRINRITNVVRVMSTVIFAATVTCDITKQRMIGHVITASSVGAMLIIAIIATRKLLAKMHASISFEQNDGNSDKSTPVKTKKTPPKEGTSDRQSSDSLDMRASIKYILRQIVILVSLGVIIVISILLLSVVSSENGPKSFYIVCYFIHYGECFVLMYFSCVVFRVKASPIKGSNTKTGGTKTVSKQISSRGGNKVSVVGGGKANEAVIDHMMILPSGEGPASLRSDLLH